MSKQPWPFAALIIATGNQHKKKQFQDLLGTELGLVVKGLDEFPQVPPIEEDRDSFAGNATKKAETLARVLGGPVIADDSGLVVPALGGAPGVYSARYAGVGATDVENNQKLMQDIKKLPPDQRSGYYVCVIAIAIPGQPTQLVRGECTGELLLDLRGNEGFGYDPMFFIPSEGATMAELPAERRYQISHRAQASRKLLQLLKEQYTFGEKE
jgi:XTP/dITP diphosphohydrolase